MRNYTVVHQGNHYDVLLTSRGHDSVSFVLDGQEHQVRIAPQLIPVSSGISTQTTPAIHLSPAPAATKTVGAPGELRSPIPGVIVQVIVKVGEQVKAGQNLLVIEAMKMENNFPSPVAGKILKVHVEAGSEVENHQLLITLDPE